MAKKKPQSIKNSSSRQRTLQEKAAYVKQIRLLDSDSTARSTEDLNTLSSEGTNDVSEGDEESIPSQTNSPTVDKHSWNIKTVVEVIAAILAIIVILWCGGMYVGSMKTEIQSLSGTVQEHKVGTTDRLSKIETDVSNLKDAHNKDIRDLDGNLRQMFSELNARLDRAFQHLSSSYQSNNNQATP